MLVTSFAYELLVVNLATISDSPLGALTTQPKPRSLDNIPQAVTHLPVRGLSSAPIQCSQSGENAGYLWEWLTDFCTECAFVIQFLVMYEDVKFVFPTHIDTCILLTRMVICITYRSLLRLIVAAMG